MTPSFRRNRNFRNLPSILRREFPKFAYTLRRFSKICLHIPVREFPKFAYTRLREFLKFTPPIDTPTRISKIYNSFIRSEISKIYLRYFADAFTQPLLSIYRIGAPETASSNSNLTKFRSNPQILRIARLTANKYCTGRVVTIRAARFSLEYRLVSRDDTILKIRPMHRTIFRKTKTPPSTGKTTPEFRHQINNSKRTLPAN